MALLKLDITKAFDSIQWPFLIEVLRRLGFGHKWQTWICGLLATSSTRIMTNGRPGKPILACQGFRQGDPLSPMLFILCMEPLYALFRNATEHGLLAHLARSSMHQRVSMFADDIVVFIKLSELEAATCRAILHLFGQASGLSVSMAKSTVLPIRCSQDEIELLSTMLGCPTAPFPCKYLGLPLTRQKQNAVQLQPLVDRVGDSLPL